MVKISSVSILGLGNIGIKYDLENGALKSTAKSHVGALLSIRPNLSFNLVEESGLFDFNLDKHLNVNKYDFDSFSSIPREYDLLILATPTKTHLELLAQLLKQHTFRFVIIEKPCGYTLNSCRAIIRLLEEKHIIWQINYFRSFLPNTLSAVDYMNELGEKPISCTISGYGDPLNISSHFIHLLTMFMDEFELGIKSHRSESNNISLTLSDGFDLNINNIRGARKHLPILNILYPSYMLVFESNGMHISLFRKSNHAMIKSFFLPSLERCQELATTEYLVRFDSCLSEQSWRVAIVHEIVSKIESYYV